MSKREEIFELPVDQLQDIFGGNDSFLKKIEKNFNVDIFDRAGAVHVVGEGTDVDKAVHVIKQLDTLSRHTGELEVQNVEYAIDAGEELKDDNALIQINSDIICHTVNGKPVRPKTLGQKKYVDAIRANTIVFGVGPAGTGKTYLAMALAITAFQHDDVSRIILTRPAIEAGEKLGFLPGDLQSKVDPYLRPLYDALYQIMGADNFQKNTEKGLIEVAPLAYMRGRTLDNAFIILDEAQNTSPAQMKMFLTRLGFNSKVVITGDKTQKDLPQGAVSGLDVAEQVLKGIDDIAVCELTSKDVVRHPLVLRIVKAYEDFEKKQQGRKKHGAQKGSDGRRSKH